MPEGSGFIADNPVSIILLSREAIKILRFDVFMCRKPLVGDILTKVFLTLLRAKNNFSCFCYGWVLKGHGHEDFADFWSKLCLNYLG